VSDGLNTLDLLQLPYQEQDSFINEGPLVEAFYEATRRFQESHLRSTLPQPSPSPSPPVCPTDLLRRTASPPLHYLDTTDNSARVFINFGPSSVRLSTLADLSPPPTNALGLIFGEEGPPSSSSITTNSPDSFITSDTDQEEESGTLTLGVPPPSPSYHVRSPTPDNTPVPSPPRVVTPSPSSPSPTLATRHHTPEAEERQDNQENIAPPGLSQNLINPYQPPACTREPHTTHPHQYYIVHHQTGDTWRPVEEAHLHSLLDFIDQNELIESPPAFASVLPFKGYSHHTALIAPTDLFQAGLFGANTIVVCAAAGLASPLTSIPLGYIHYSFRASIKDTFQQRPTSHRICYSGALILSEVYDFLDGRRIFVYGFLYFDSGRIFITNQSYFCEDAARVHTHLLRYTLTPRLPLDPFLCIGAFRDEDPL